MDAIEHMFATMEAMMEANEHKFSTLKVALMDSQIKNVENLDTLFVTSKVPFFMALIDSKFRRMTKETMVHKDLLLLLSRFGGIS